MLNTYKIIKIIGEKEILVNYGIRNGAEIGDKLRIIVKGPEVTFDDQSFGTLDAVKEYIEVTTPYERFSVCKKIRRISRSVFSPLSEMQTTSIRSEPMDIDKEQIDSSLARPKVGPIQVGDIVEKL